MSGNGHESDGELQVFEARLKTLLPEEYRECYEDVQPVSMGSAGLKFDSEGRVAWNEIWGSFCDLAMAGGPPHRGKLLEPATKAEIDADRAGYRNVINELTMKQNNWTLGAYCAQYCRFVTGHHSLEDRSVFPHLRRSDPALTPVLDRLEQAHLVIHDVLEQVDDALVGLVSGVSGTAELKVVVDELSRVLLEHLAYEEEELVPALDRYGFA